MAPAHRNGGSGLAGVAARTAKLTVVRERRTVINFGVRTLLLLLSAIVFVLAVFAEEDYNNLVAWGLAAIALAFVLSDIGWDRKYSSRR